MLIDRATHSCQLLMNSFPFGALMASGGVQREMVTAHFSHVKRDFHRIFHHVYWAAEMFACILHMNFEQLREMAAPDVRDWACMLRGGLNVYLVSIQNLHPLGH